MALSKAILVEDAASARGGSIPDSVADNYSQPFLIELEPKEHGKLPIPKTTFNATSNAIVDIEHWFTEQSTSVFLGDDAVFYPRGLIAINNALLLESLTPTFVTLHDHESGSIYKDFGLKAGASSIDINSTEAIEILDPRLMYACPFVYACSNFGHWHYNVLSSIALLEKHLPSAKLLLPSLSAYQRESLVLLGLDLDRIVEISGQTPVHVPNLAFPSSSWTWNGIPNPRLSYLPMQRMAAVAASNNICLPGFANPKKIYISRLGEKIRSISNEEEVCALFEKYGFSIIKPVDFGYGEIIPVFANAEFIAGPVGAALTRIGFCRPGFDLLQLSPDSSVDYLFHSNACFAGARKSYVYLEDSCNIVHGSSSKIANQIKEWSIDIPKLDFFLSSIF
jgi:hypothetical protein